MNFLSSHSYSDIKNTNVLRIFKTAVNNYKVSSHEALFRRLSGIERIIVIMGEAFINADIAIDTPAVT